MENTQINEILERIRQRRIELDLSYQDLSAKTGISKSTLQRYETGFIKNLPIDKLEILAKALNTTPEYLMGWDSEKRIKTAEEAMQFILKQPVLMSYGGYDIKTLTDDELVDFANELLRQLELISYKYKK